MSDFEELIQTCTAETNTRDNWPVIVHICQLAEKNDGAARVCVAALIKRFQHKNLNVFSFIIFTFQNSTSRLLCLR